MIIISIKDRCISFTNKSQPIPGSNFTVCMLSTQIKSTNMGDMRGQFKDWEEVQATIVDQNKPIFEDEDGLVYEQRSCFYPFHRFILPL